MITVAAVGRYIATGWWIIGIQLLWTLKYTIRNVCRQRLLDIYEPNNLEGHSLYYNSVITDAATINEILCYCYLQYVLMAGGTSQVSQAMAWQIFGLLFIYMYNVSCL